MDSVIFIDTTAFTEYSPTGYIYSLPNLTIQCHDYSYAYEYAEENKINIQAIDVTASMNYGFYKIYSDIPLSCVLVMCNYTTDDELVTGKTKEPENVSEYKFAPENSYVTRIMAWIGLDNMRPIANAVTIE